jgi:hypothetical protein
MPTVAPTTTYGKPRYTTHRNPYATRHYHDKGTRASQPYYLHKYDDINKQLKFEKKMMKAHEEKAAKLAKRTAELKEEKMKAWREARGKTGGRRPRRGTRSTRRR